MPQCSAINCSNRPEKGFKLFRFPAEVKRQQKWVEYCNRKDWVPTKNSALCELHFSADQFRTDLTEDGKRLNRDAVPSVLVQPRQSLTSSRGRKKSTPSSHTQNIITEAPKSEGRKFRTSNVSTSRPSTRKTKRWTRLPEVEWSYDHLYSKRRRIYFEIVESCALTGKVGGKSDDQKPALAERADKRLQDKVEDVVNANFCNDADSISDWNVKELRDAIDDAIETKKELQRQLRELSAPKESTVKGGACESVDAFRSDLQDDLPMLDLYMTVDEVNDESVADGEETRTVMIKRLENLEMFEKMLKVRLAKKLEEESPEEESCPVVGEVGPTEIHEDGECTESERSGKFPAENPVVGVIDSCVAIPSADSQGANSSSLQTSAQPAVENGSPESYTESSGFVCENCGKMFSSFYQMHSHQRIHLNKKRRRPRMCYICRKSFLLLGRHLRTHSGERPYRCLHCARQFSRLDNLQNHIRSHADRSGKRHACDRCGLEFPDQHESRLHERTHRGETLYGCGHCDRQFLYRNVWKTHVKSHVRKKQFLCNVCGKQFVQANNLRDHIAGVHSAERSHECRICGKSFVRAISLKLHANSHTGNRPHSCDRCTKRFFSSGSLSAHMRIHYGETPFVCSVCSKCFRYSCHLRIHMRVHTGEKPFQCLICSKSFTQNGNLKEHMRIHSPGPAQDDDTCVFIKTAATI